MTFWLTNVDQEVKEKLNRCVRDFLLEYTGNTVTTSNMVLQSCSYYSVKLLRKTDA